jgi:GrpB-like predicted nucleotidyltransferase (UPF0157 family)
MFGNRPIERTFPELTLPSGGAAVVFADSDNKTATRMVVRDYLRMHPDIATQYGALKKRLADQFPHDIDSYIDGKTDLILRILRWASFRPDELNNIEGLNRRSV